MKSLRKHADYRNPRNPPRRNSSLEEPLPGGTPPWRNSPMEDFFMDESSIADRRWFFGATTRHRAEEILLSPGNTAGAFVVRRSESAANQLTLSVRFGGDGSGVKSGASRSSCVSCVSFNDSRADVVLHFRIFKTKRGFCIGDFVASSVSRLIRHYEQNELRDSKYKPVILTEPRLESAHGRGFCYL